MTEPSKHRRQWCAMLSKLVAPMDATTATKALVEMLPMLADVADGAFTAGSLDAVAGAVRRVPTYSELRNGLIQWWEANRPPVAELAEGGGIGLTVEDQRWLSWWRRREAQNFEPLRDAAGYLLRPDVADWRAHAMSMLRARAPTVARRLEPV